MTRASHWLRWWLGSTILLLAGVVLWRQVHGFSLGKLRAAWAGTWIHDAQALVAQLQSRAVQPAAV